MAEQAVETPNAGTFDLTEWVQGNITYPRFTATVYLDRETAAQVYQLDERAKSLLTALGKAEKEASQPDPFASMTENSSAAQRHEDITKELNQLRPRREQLVAKLKKSAVTVTFGVEGKGFDERVNKQVRAKFPEQLKDASARDILELVRDDDDVASYRMSVQLKETIREIRRADGQKAELSKLTVEQVRDFVESLNNSDQNKIYRNMNLSITGGNSVDQAIDAGFPG